MLFDPKLCLSCKKIKPAQDFYFRKQTGKLQGDCKTCYQNKKQKRIKERKANGELKYTPKKKKCLDCNEMCDARPRILRCYKCENSRRWEDKNKILKHIEQNKKMWQNEDYRNKMSSLMKQSRQNPDFNDKLLSSFSCKLSKLHRKIKKELNLEKLGFISEQRVDKYFVDEINKDKKIIIEINGDYVHANPKSFVYDSIIKLPGNTYTAAEKWESDKQKIDTLTSMGYKVITIWESDDLEEVKKQVNLEISCKNI